MSTEAAKLLNAQGVNLDVADVRALRCCHWLRAYR